MTMIGTITAAVPESSVSPGTPARDQTASAVDFNQVLARARAEASNGTTVEGGQRVHLGTLNAQRDTISELLVQNPEYRKETWRIIQNPLNQGKPYQQIPKGTSIYLNPETRELSWQGVPESRSPDVRTPETGGVSSHRADSHGNGLISLGRLSRANPTVSHLLVRHPQGGAETWNIIHGEQNNSKSFNTLALGTEVYLNPASGELSWSSRPDGTGTPSGSQIVDQARAPDSPGPSPVVQSRNTPQMAQAVRSFMGESYKAMDCYELVVNGLEKMGVRYLGRGGLKANLVDRALQAGLPANTYLTGEGIIDAAGSRLYAQTVHARQADGVKIQQIMKDLKPLLGQGDILAFSTPSRGHVGVVDRNQETWTFLNSGYLDNDLQTRRPRKGVGEELLSAEIQNWLNLASRRREPLRISLGRLEPHKLTSFSSG